MNISITRAVAAALAVVAVAPAASAASVGVKAKAVIGATTYTDITSVASILYISGSTAVGPALKYWGIDTNDTSRLCQAGTATIYTGSSPKFTAVACLASAGFTSGLSAGTPVAFIKEDSAGSLNGILPLQNKSVPGATYTTDGGQNYPVLSTLAYTGTASVSNGCYGTTKSGTALDTYMNVTCTTVTGTRIVPHLGYSDVEAAVFGVNTTGLTSGSTVELPFGIAVNAGFYHALQAVQGLTQDDTLANMPSLTRTEIASMMNGTYLFAPTQIVGTDGTTSAANASVVWGYTNGKCYNGTANTTTAVTSPCAAAVTSDTTAIYICRRGDTSGTEKSAEIFLNDQGCTSNTAKILLPATLNGTAICTSGTTTDGCSWSSAYQTGVYSFTGGGTGDLLDCLVGQDNAGHFAIGFASVDNLNGSVQTNTTRRDFRYVRIDGVAPSIEAAAAGKYPFVAESVYYVPTTQVTALGTEAAALLASLTSTTQGLGTVGSISAVNAALNNTTQGFHAGVLAIPKAGGAQPSNANALNATFMSNPVSTIVHEDGGAVNNCLRPQTYIGTNTTGTGGKYNWVPANN